MNLIPMKSKKNLTYNNCLPKLTPGSPLIYNPFSNSTPKKLNSFTFIILPSLFLIPLHL